MMVRYFSDYKLASLMIDENQQILSTLSDFTKKRRENELREGYYY